MSVVQVSENRTKTNEQNSKAPWWNWLTVESTPACDIAALPMRKSEALLREAGGHDGVREGDGWGQFDQGDVITVNKIK